MKKWIVSFTFTFSLYLLPFAQGNSPYEGLVNIQKELRVLEKTTTPNGVPDYRVKTIGTIQQKLAQLQGRHKKMDTTGWSRSQKVDYLLVLSELNALDYNCRILRPWMRDPAFYALIWNEQSDTPDHEGPNSFAVIDLWKYSFPLSASDETALAKQLQVIPPLYAQARENLTGNARDLWEAGIGNIKDQVGMLDELSKQTASTGAALQKAIQEARKSCMDLVSWLQQQLPSKNGASGIGKENYNWHLKHVMMTDMTWEDEVMLLKRELTRAHSSLQLEREHNKLLPELNAFSSADAFKTGTDQAVRELMDFLQQQKIMPVRPYYESALRQHIGSFIPEDKRNFFANISFRAPGVLYSHSTHWFEVAGLSLDPHPNPLRREALPYNIWMQRSEGLATAMEEIFMHAGLWDKNPRARELVWIMLAQRCARGLASLYAQANMINYEQARRFQVEWTPKGWTGDESLVGFEQHLYLRQPGYGTSYVTGKYLIEQLIMDMGRRDPGQFSLYKFFEQFYGVGILPVPLVRRAME